MSRATSPYIVGDYWLDKRRDGKSPEVWQIARAVKRSILYRSTHCTGLDDAKGRLDAYVAEQRALSRQDAREAEVVPMLMTYWNERGKAAINSDQTARSIRTFIAFLAQDVVGARAVVTDLIPATFERFRKWRMGPHSFAIPWAGKKVEYASDGVSGATVQRNINDIRAAVLYAEDNLRIPMSPRIRDIDQRYRSPPRERLLSIDELAHIAWYARHNKHLFRFVALQVATGARPQAALAFDPARQFDPATGLIDLQPDEAPQTKKRNAIIPAIRPLRPVLSAWACDGASAVGSRKTAWRIMRRTLGLSDDVHPKTIRHTIATMLHADPSVPEREVSELLGHEGKLARTTRIYAKYDPAHLSNAVRALTTIWLQISRTARAYAADHLLTTEGQGGKNVVAVKMEKC